MITKVKTSCKNEVHLDIKNEYINDRETVKNVTPGRPLLDIVLHILIFSYTEVRTLYQKRFIT